MKTKLIRSTHRFPKKLQGGVLTIGNFDGVHLGHQALLSQTVEAARQRGVPAIVVTFEPHAFEFFGGEQLSIPRLTRLREKFYAIAANKLDGVLILQFNQTLASQSASDFISQLHAALKPSHWVIGDDFHFGKGREGNYDLLLAKGKDLGFTVEQISTSSLNGERISSTRVRKALAIGDHAKVRQLLGRAYSMQGRVRQGDKIGRQLGFPTANIYLHRKLTPVHGIYTVLIHGLEAQPVPGVANVGTRPTVNGTRTLLEVHLLDFNQDIYGRYVEVEFCKKLRDEVRYPNLDLLKKQIAKDVKQGRKYFKNIRK